MAATRCSQLLRCISTAAPPRLAGASSVAATDAGGCAPSWDAADPARFTNLAFWDSYHEGTAHGTLAHHEWFVEAGMAIEAVLPTLEAICAGGLEGPPATPPTVLHLGCGTSALGLRLAALPIAQAAGVHVTNLDFSTVAINAMRGACQSALNAEGHFPDGGSAVHRNSWVVANALAMPFGRSDFDLVLDKGTFDAFECADAAATTGAPSSSRPSAARLCEEVDRVLKRHARAAWVQITHSAPELRLEALQASLPPAGGSCGVHDAWSVGFRSLGAQDGGFEYFAYTVRRRPRFAVFCESSGREEEVARFVDEHDAEIAAQLLEGRRPQPGGGGFKVRAL